jgi:hypothetical protein
VSDPRERRRYELTEAELKELRKAITPDPLIYGSGGVPLFRSQQQKANDAWAELGKRMGFRWETVLPASGGDRFFSAEPLEDDL